MCLCPEHFLLPAVPVVPGGGTAAGQGTGNCPALPAGREAVCRMRGVVPARFQPRQILPGLRRYHETDQGRRAQAETKGEMSRFRG